LERIIGRRLRARERIRGKNPLQRLLEIDSPPGYEVIPWTPEELDKMIAKRNPLALELLQHGIILRDDLGLREKIEQYRRSLPTA